MVADEGKGSRQRTSKLEGFQEVKQTLDDGIVYSYHSGSQALQHIKNYQELLKIVVSEPQTI